MLIICGAETLKLNSLKVLQLITFFKKDTGMRGADGFIGLIIREFEHLNFVGHESTSEKDAIHA